MKLLAFVVAALLFTSISADKFAVLVAGSNAFYNYRHQTDVCHAYKLLREKGMPADNIIVLSFDDVASSSQNPFPGQLFNKPTDAGTPGVDVYAGCEIDYKGLACNPDNYIAVITGGQPSGGNGRVLQSTSEDHVFINFVDHGGMGLIGFPTTYLYKDQFIQSLETMHEKNMYGKLTYYMEACESGSMFENLLSSDINIYATTAANAYESSWGFYCYPDDSVDGTEIGSCLGDLYSISWMEDSDEQDIHSETLQTQYENVKTRTTKSHVMQYGDLSFTDLHVGAFQGGSQSVVARLMTKKQVSSEFRSGHVNSRDNKMHYLTRKFNRKPTQENFDELQQEMTEVKFFEDKFQQFKKLNNLTGAVDTYNTDFDCYRSLIEQFEEKCGKVGDNGMRHFIHFFEKCQSETDVELTKLQINMICA